MGKPSESAHAVLTTRDDGTFIRTAVQVGHGNGDSASSTSIDLVNPVGEHIATLNLFRFSNGRICVDVIPTATEHDGRILTFPDGGREITPLLGTLAAIDFREA